MAKRKATRRVSSAKRTRSRTAPKRAAKRPTRKTAPRRKPRPVAKSAKKRRPAAAKRAATRKAAGRPKAARRVKAAARPATARPAAARPTARPATPRPAAARPAAARPSRFGGVTPTRQDTRKKTPRLDRVRRTLDDTVPTPPSSLDMERHGSAARTGRAEIAEQRHDHASMTPAITAGDLDVDVEDAYFTGDEAPGGDNSTPDQDVVDDIGKALGVQYDDNEELKGSDKIIERDKHRWEMDPASSEDYKDRK